MKVICTGMPKTGTKSLCSALRILGYKVYDFEEQIWFIHDELKSVLDNGCTNEEIRRIFDGVDATTDFPACFIWELLFKAFPDAKVIHCERKNEDEWIKSFLHQVMKVRTSFFLRMLLMLSYTGLKCQNYGNSATRVGVGMEASKPWNRSNINYDVIKMRYREHNSHVKQTVPKDQFLELKLGDGWGPLCKFLNVPIPDQEFPHRNKGGVIIDELMDESLVFKRVKQECLLSLSVITVAVSYAIYNYYPVIKSAISSWF